MNIPEQHKTIYSKLVYIISEINNLQKLDNLDMSYMAELQDEKTFLENQLDDNSSLADKVETGLEVGLYFNNGKYKYLTNDLEYMFSWSNISEVEDICKKIIILINKNLDNQEMLNNLLSTEISDLIQLI